MKNLVYEDIPKYDLWLKLLLYSVLALPFILGVVLLFQDIDGAWVMFGITLFDAMLFKAVLPQRFQIFGDRVRIVLGGPFAFNIPFSNIRDVRLTSSRRVFIYRGIRFATSYRGVVEIVRKKGLSLVISPVSGDLFVEQFNQALEAAPGTN